MLGIKTNFTLDSAIKTFQDNTDVTILQKASSYSKAEIILSICTLGIYALLRNPRDEVKEAAEFVTKMIHSDPEEGLSVCIDMDSGDRFQVFNDPKNARVMIEINNQVRELCKGSVNDLVARLKIDYQANQSLYQEYYFLESTILKKIGSEDLTETDLSKILTDYGPNYSPGVLDIDENSIILEVARSAPPLTAPEQELMAEIRVELRNEKNQMKGTRSGALLNKADLDLVRQSVQKKLFEVYRPNESIEPDIYNWKKAGLTEKEKYLLCQVKGSEKFDPGTVFSCYSCTGAPDDPTFNLMPLIVRYSLEHGRKDPNADAVYIEPTDGDEDFDKITADQVEGLCEPSYKFSLMTQRQKIYEDNKEAIDQALLKVYRANNPTLNFITLIEEVEELALEPSVKPHMISVELGKLIADRVFNTPNYASCGVQMLDELRQIKRISDEIQQVQLEEVKSEKVNLGTILAPENIHARLNDFLKGTGKHLIDQWDKIFGEDTDDKKFCQFLDLCDALAQGGHGVEFGPLGRALNVARASIDNLRSPVEVIEQSEENILV